MIRTDHKPWKGGAGHVERAAEQNLEPSRADHGCELCGHQTPRGRRGFDDDVRTGKAGVLGKCRSYRFARQVSFLRCHLNCCKNGNRPLKRRESLRRDMTSNSFDN
jgi:hypothetical protein